MKQLLVINQSGLRRNAMGLFFRVQKNSNQVEIMISTYNGVTNYFYICCLLLIDYNFF